MANKKSDPEHCAPTTRKYLARHTAAQIAGHSTVRQPYDYSLTQLKRQEEITRAIQERLVSGRHEVQMETPARVQ